MNEGLDYDAALEEAKQLDTNLAKCYLELVESEKKHKEALSKILEKIHYFGPFICGHGEEMSPGGMYKTILVCPAYGSDGMAVYKLETDYSAPSY